MIVKSSMVNCAVLNCLSSMWLGLPSQWESLCIFVSIWITCSRPSWRELDFLAGGSLFVVHVDCPPEHSTKVLFRGSEVPVGRIDVESSFLRQANKLRCYEFEDSFLVGQGVEIGPSHCD